MPDWQALKSRFETLQNSLQKFVPLGKKSDDGVGSDMNQQTQGAQ